MQITRKIRMYRDEIKANPVGSTSQRIQAEAVAAILEGFEGVGKENWVKYMSNFHSNERQLERLIGKDEIFNEDNYALIIFAYILGGGVCGGGTGLALAADMPYDLRRRLDRNLPTATAPNIETPEEVLQFREYDDSRASVADDSK